MSTRDIKIYYDLNLTIGNKESGGSIIFVIDNRETKILTYDIGFFNFCVFSKTINKTPINTNKFESGIFSEIVSDLAKYPITLYIFVISYYCCLFPNKIENPFEQLSMFRLDDKRDTDKYIEEINLFI